VCRRRVPGAECRVLSRLSPVHRTPHSPVDSRGAVG
jgi:hypothetical protein